MTNFIIILGLLVPFLGAGLYLYFQIRKSGRNEERLKHTEKANENLKDENKDLANRPRNKSDRRNRLQQWRDKLLKNKN